MGYVAALGSFGDAGFTAHFFPRRVHTCLDRRDCDFGLGVDVGVIKMVFTGFHVLCLVDDAEFRALITG